MYRSDSDQAYLKKTLALLSGKVGEIIDENVKAPRNYD